MANRYSWRPGARISIDAQAAGKEMERLRKSNGGALLAENVLDSARSHNSALHEHFEWDDALAADQHRLSQAGELIRSITVDISKSNMETTPVRAFVSVERDGRRSYTSTAHAMSDVNLRRQLLQAAWAEMAAFKKKYGELRELAKVFEAMDRVRPAA